MASRANGVGKARGALLIQPSGEEANARRTEVVTGRVEEQWESVRRFVGDKESKGRIRCLKLERMIDALVRGGEILIEVPDEYRQRGIADFVSLKRARIKCWIVKLDGTNKSRPVCGKWSLTPEDLLWACQDNSEAPANIGDFRPGQLPHLRLTIFQNWVRDIHTDREREAQIFDLLKLVSWKGIEYMGTQPFELVGHDIVVNRDTLELYGEDVRDSFIVASAVKPHARQLNLVTPPDQRDVYEAAQDYIKGLGASLYRASDGAVLDDNGAVLYHAERIEGEDLAIEGTAVSLGQMRGFGDLVRAVSAPIGDDDESDDDNMAPPEDKITGVPLTPEELAFFQGDEDEDDEDDDDE